MQNYIFETMKQRNSSFGIYVIFLQIGCFIISSAVPVTDDIESNFINPLSEMQIPENNHVENLADLNELTFQIVKNNNLKFKPHDFNDLEEIFKNIPRNNNNILTIKYTYHLNHNVFPEVNDFNEVEKEIAHRLKRKSEKHNISEPSINDKYVTKENELNNKKSYNKIHEDTDMEEINKSNKRKLSENNVFLKNYIRVTNDTDYKNKYLKNTFAKACQDMRNDNSIKLPTENKKFEKNGIKTEAPFDNINNNINCPLCENKHIEDLNCDLVKYELEKAIKNFGQFENDLKTHKINKRDIQIKRKDKADDLLIKVIVRIPEEVYTNQLNKKQSKIKEIEDDSLFYKIYEQDNPNDCNKSVIRKIKKPFEKDWGDDLIIHDEDNENEENHQRVLKETTEFRNDDDILSFEILDGSLSDTHKIKQEIDLEFIKSNKEIDNEEDDDDDDDEEERNQIDEKVKEIKDDVEFINKEDLDNKTVILQEDTTKLQVEITSGDDNLYNKTTEVNEDQIKKDDEDLDNKTVVFQKINRNVNQNIPRFSLKEIQSKYNKDSNTEQVEDEEEEEGEEEDDDDDDDEDVDILEEHQKPRDEKQENFIKEIKNEDMAIKNKTENTNGNESSVIGKVATSDDFDIEQLKDLLTLLMTKLITNELTKYDIISINNSKLEDERKDLKHNTYTNKDFKNETTVKINPLNDKINPDVLFKPNYQNISINNDINPLNITLEAKNTTEINSEGNITNISNDKSKILEENKTINVNLSNKTKFKNLKGKLKVNQPKYNNFKNNNSTKEFVNKQENLGNKTITSLNSGENTLSVNKNIKDGVNTNEKKTQNSLEPNIRAKRFFEGRYNEMPMNNKLPLTSNSVVGLHLLNKLMKYLQKRTNNLGTRYIYMNDLLDHNLNCHRNSFINVYRNTLKGLSQPNRKKYFLN